MTCTIYGSLKVRDVIIGQNATPKLPKCFPNSIIVSANNGNYLFNGELYETKYGIYKGTYTFINIPSSHPMGFVSPNESAKISYVGNQSPLIKEVAGYMVNHYHGTITLTINEDLTEDLSYHCSSHGYMGGLNKIMYTNVCQLTTLLSEKGPLKLYSYQNKLRLTIDTSQIPGNISGLQLYLEGIKLKEKTSETSFYTGHPEWIIASNYIENENLSIMYFESIGSARISNSGTEEVLNDFEYVEELGNPIVVTSKNDFSSVIVNIDSETSEIVKYDLL